MSSRPTTVFDPANTPYRAFRIPAIVRAGSQLLAFAEGRITSAADDAEIELVLRRSPDEGRTWLPAQVVARSPGMTCGNPAPVVDPASGDVVLVSMRNGQDVNEDLLTRGADPANGRRVYVQRSADDGATWSSAAEITEQVKPPDWGWYATGPCHGIALEHHERSGRLLIPANHSSLARPPGMDPDSRARRSGGHCILSDDGGHTWRLGFVDRNDDGVINANETTAAELADGTVYVNARNHRGSGSARVHARSIDGGESLTAPYAEMADVTAPGIQGSVLRMNGRLLLSTPTDPRRRRNLTVFVSDDDGTRWRVGTAIHSGPAGYSDLVPLAGGSVGILYEAGDADDASSFASIRFHTFDPRTLDHRSLS